MGNYVNKVLAHNHETHNEKQEVEPPMVKILEQPKEINMCTPVSLHKKLFVDPRSASTGIHRTPIEVNSTPVTSNRRATELHTDRKVYLETDLDSVMPPLTPKKAEPRLLEPAVESQKDYLTPTMRNNANFPRKLTTTERNRFRLLGIDPRSPAADFSRTPILTPASLLRLRARSQENLNRRGSYETDMCRYSYCEMSSEFGVPEVQALPDLAATAIKALNLVDVQCEDELNQSETSCSDDSPNSVILVNSKYESNNVDVKFDNANVQKYMCSTDVSPSREDSSKRHKESLEQVKVSLNLDDYETEATETETDDKDDKPIAEEAKESTKNSSETEKIIVWRDSMSVLPELKEAEILESTNQTKISDKTLPHTTKDEVIITFDDEMVVKDNLSSKISKAPSENQRKPEIIRRNKNTKGDKMLAEDKKVFSDNKTSLDTAKTRTPLGNRSNNGQVSLLAAKSPQVLRNKGITPKMLQENTPPHRRSTVKSKLSGIQWDPDSTVLI